MILKITLLTGKISELEDEFEFPLKVRSSVQIRRMTLRIDSRNRQVILSVPRLCRIAKARAFVEDHRPWIEDHLLLLPPQEDFKSDSAIMLFGKKLTLLHQPDTLSAPHIADDVLIVGGEAAFFHRRVKDYIRRSAQKEFEKRSRILAEKLGVTLIGVSIKDTKSRWGSCSSLNHINYSWRIALAPESVIDYLMAHEVAHLKHRDHSTAFWKCVCTLNPEASIGKNWLKQHGNELYRYR